MYEYNNTCMIVYIHTYPYLDIDAGAKVLLYNFIFESVRAAGPAGTARTPASDGSRKLKKGWRRTSTRMAL